MKPKKSGTISVECPCCGSRILIDDTYHKVIAHEGPPSPRSNSFDLGEAASRLQEQAKKREAAFQQSAEDLKIHSQLLDRKFEEALERNRGLPITKPTRDIDLD